MTSAVLSFDVAFAAFLADRQGQAIQAQQEADAEPEAEPEIGR